MTCILRLEKNGDNMPAIKGRRQSPRLADDTTRRHVRINLPEVIYEAIETIAIDEKYTVSWVTEQMICDMVGIILKYKPKRNNQWQEKKMIGRKT